MRTEEAMTKQKKSAKGMAGVRLNNKRNKQAKAGLFIPKLGKTDLPKDYVCTGILLLESQRDWGRLCKMAPVRKSIIFYNV